MRPSCHQILLVTYLLQSTTAQPSTAVHQTPFILMEAPSASIQPLDRVPGSNDATFGPVPVAEQIFEMEFLEIAPTPMPM